ncbi:MAG TPA: hypothetical protein VFP45_03375 [Candidatus Nitrosotalea sp.]|nr:hypothetical protein [Candidatus Nitrosotalea sp.]
MPKQKRSTSTKKKWNQKKKSGQPAKNPNRGLPGDYIQRYGDPSVRTLISGDAWSEFYSSTAGRTRATKLAARYARRLAQQEQKLAITPADVAGFRQNTNLDQVRIANAQAEVAASRK